MKAVVLEIKNGYAAVLTEDGSIIKTRRRCSVGDTIEITTGELAGPAPNYTKRLVRVAAIAAAVVLIVLGVSGGYYYTAMAATTVTIHASEGDLTLSLNRMDRVIKVESSGSLREDTVETLYSEGIKNCALSEALEKASGILGTDSSEENSDAWLIDLETENEKKFEKMKGQIEEKGFRINSSGPAAEKDSFATPADERPVEFSQSVPGQEFSENPPQDTAFGQSFEGQEMTEEAQSSGQVGQPEMIEEAQPSGQSGQWKTTDPAQSGTTNPDREFTQSESSEGTYDFPQPGNEGQTEIPGESSGEPGADHNEESSGQPQMGEPGGSSGQTGMTDTADSAGAPGLGNPPGSADRMG